MPLSLDFREKKLFSDRFLKFFGFNSNLKKFCFAKILNLGDKEIQFQEKDLSPSN
jgi:hypothetical protein